MAFTKEHARATIQFMQRVQLQGSEVPAYMEVMQALVSYANAEEPASAPNGRDKQPRKQARKQPQGNDNGQSVAASQKGNPRPGQ